MLVSRKSGDDWDLSNEINKVNVRWFLIVAISVYLFYLLQGGQTGVAVFNDVKGTYNLSFIAALFVCTSSLNLLYHLYLRRRKKLESNISPVWKYITMGGDFVLVTLILLPTGGDESMFFFVYFIVIVSNGIRYGMRLAIAGVLIFNISYFGALMYQYYPETSLPGFQKEFLKVLGVWAVGLYIGYLSQRFEALHTELTVYQKMLKEKIGAQNPSTKAPPKRSTKGLQKAAKRDSR